MNASFTHLAYRFSSSVDLYSALFRNTHGLLPPSSRVVGVRFAVTVGLPRLLVRI